ncbi:MAG: hypothetical protein DI538_09940 [Azospira oryzae]|nr:MAG: hypothetical protein DI538_09940 [Azospira oryzae]
MHLSGCALRLITSMKSKFSFLVALFLITACDNKFSWIEPPPPLPVVTRITPDTGTAGTEVTIAGAHFSPTLQDKSVTINGTPATIVDVTSSTIIFIVPTGTTGAVIVTVNGQPAENKPVFTYK